MLDDSSTIIDMRQFLDEPSPSEDHDEMKFSQDMCREMDQLRDEYNFELNRLRKSSIRKLDEVVKKYQDME